MASILRPFLAVTLLALAGTSAAAPVSYGYFGTIVSTTSGSFPGANPGDPISITVRYDPAAVPAQAISVSNGTIGALGSINGTVNGEPWVTWMQITATFDGYTWQNDLAGTYENTGSYLALDGLSCGSGCFEDLYQPFFVEQFSTPNGDQTREIYWQIFASATSEDVGLTHGVSVPQPIDLSNGTQTGFLFTLDPGSAGQALFFDLTRIDVPLFAPEPATLALLGLGLAGLGFSRRRRLNSPH